MKHSSVASTFSTEGYWSAERQRILYYHDFHTKTKRCFRKRISAQLPATILLWLIVILVTISLTAMTAVVNGDSDVDDGSWTSRNGPIYMGSIANNPNFGNNVHTQKQFSVYSSDIIVNSDLDADEVNDDEEELDDESNNSIDGRLSTADIEKLHAIVMQGLRLTRIPNIANVSSSFFYLPDYTSFRYVFNTNFTDFVSLAFCFKFIVLFLILTFYFLFICPDSPVYGKNFQADSKMCFVRFGAIY